MTAWSCKTWEFLKAIFAFFGKTTHYGKIFKILFRKFTWRHRLTLLCSNVVKFFRREIGEIVRYLPDRKKTNKISATAQTVATAWIAPKIFQGHPPTFGSQCSKFHPYGFTFGGVIAERVKAVLLAHRVFAIFARKPSGNNNVIIPAIAVSRCDVTDYRVVIVSKRLRC